MRVIYLFRMDYNSQDTWEMVELRENIGIVGWNSGSPSYSYDCERSKLSSVKNDPDFR